VDKNKENRENRKGLADDLVDRSRKDLHRGKMKEK
jgi:hypothetical protein